MDNNAEITMDEYQIAMLPMDSIHCDNEFNSRGEINLLTVVDLAKNILTHGLQTPIMVRRTTPEVKSKTGKDWWIIAGHRRFLAFKLNKATEIPCFVKDVDEDTARDLNLGENIYRSQLTLTQEARGVAFYLNQGYKVAQVAEKLGRSPGWVEVRKHLMELPKEVQDEADKGIVQQGHIKSLYSLRRDPNKLMAALKSLKESASRGEKIHIKKVETIVDVVKRKKPTVHEVEEFLSFAARSLTEQTKTTHPLLRGLAWSQGNISKLEAWAYLRDLCKEAGTKFYYPPEMEIYFGEKKPKPSE